MQKTSASKTAAPTKRPAAQQSPLRKAAAAPQPLDLKTLERVAGGTTELPKRTW